MSIQPTSPSALWQQLVDIEEESMPLPTQQSAEVVVAHPVARKPFGLTRSSASLQRLDLLAAAEENPEIQSAKKAFQEKLIYFLSPLPPTTAEQAERAEKDMVRKTRELRSLQALIGDLNDLRDQESGPISYDHRECLSSLKDLWEDEKKNMILSRSRLMLEDPRGYRHRITNINYLLQHAIEILSCETIEELDSKEQTVKDLCEGAQETQAILSEHILKLQNNDIPRQRLLIETLRAKETYFALLQQHGMPIPSIEELYSSHTNKRSILSLEPPIEKEQKCVLREPQSAADLMEAYMSSLDDMPFYESTFIKSLKEHIDLHSAYTSSAGSMGYIEKKILNETSQICVRADIHGDIKSLTANLKAFQSQGLLDESFRCTSNCHLVFLGDYMDRGEHSMQVLELLIALKRENPAQVTLIKGNHESIFMNQMYSGLDSNLMSFLEPEENKDLLTEFYKSLPLSSFIGQKDEHGGVQYTMFTHGMFELSLDPSPILCNTETSFETLEVFPPALDTTDGQYSQLARRIKEIRYRSDVNYSELLASEQRKPERKQLKLEMAAKRITALAFSDKRPFYSCGNDRYPNLPTTAFNWGDVERESGVSLLIDLGTRNWKLSPEDIKHYMRLISVGDCKVKLLFRGHEHLKQHHEFNGKIVATTLPVAMLGLYKDYFQDQPDTTYVLTTNPKVSQWLKKPYVCDPKDCSTTIFNDYPIGELSI